MASSIRKKKLTVVANQARQASIQKFKWFKVISIPAANAVVEFSTSSDVDSEFFPMPTNCRFESTSATPYEGLTIRSSISGDVVIQYSLDDKLIQDPLPGGSIVSLSGPLADDQISLAVGDFQIAPLTATIAAGADAQFNVKSKFGAVFSLPGQALPVSGQLVVCNGTVTFASGTPVYCIQNKTWYPDGLIPFGDIANGITNTWSFFVPMIPQAGLTLQGQGIISALYFKNSLNHALTLNVGAGNSNFASLSLATPVYRNKVYTLASIELAGFTGIINSGIETKSLVIPYAGFKDIQILIKWTMAGGPTAFQIRPVLVSSAGTEFSDGAFINLGATADGSYAAQIIFNEKLPGGGILNWTSGNSALGNVVVPGNKWKFSVVNGGGGTIQVTELEITLS